MSEQTESVSLQGRRAQQLRQQLQDCDEQQQGERGGHTGLRGNIDVSDMNFMFYMFNTINQNYRYLLYCVSTSRGIITLWKPSK